MPILDTAANTLNSKLDTATPADAQKFAPGAAIDAAFVYPHDAVRRQVLQDYIDSMPGGIREGLRATIHEALSSTPRTKVNLVWQPAYDWELSVTQTPTTALTAGVITILLRSRYLGDPHPLQADIVQFQQTLMLRSERGVGARSKPGRPQLRGMSSSRGKGTARPAKAKPSKRS